MGVYIYAMANFELGEAGEVVAAAFRDEQHWQESQARLADEGIDLTVFCGKKGPVQRFRALAAGMGGVIEGTIQTSERRRMLLAQSWDKTINHLFGDVMSMSPVVARAGGGSFRFGVAIPNPTFQLTTEFTAQHAITSGPCDGGRLSYDFQEYSYCFEYPSVLLSGAAVTILNLAENSK